MKYTLLKTGAAGISVPECVFDNLHDCSGNDLKVVLYIIRTENTDPLKISSDLNISHSAANSSLLYWADKGLVLAEEESAKPAKKKSSLTSEIVATLSSDPGVQALVKNLQIIFGGSVNEKYTNKFLSLYLEESIPVDVILQIAQHHITTGMDNPAYIIKVIRSWHSKLGLTTGREVDEYLALEAKREKVYAKVCEIFKITPEQLKSSDKKLIDRWQEKFNMSFEMIEESRVRAGNLASIPYCNGILKSWSQKGYASPKDLDAVIVNITESKRNIDSQQDTPARKIRKVPTLKD